MEIFRRDSAQEDPENLEDTHVVFSVVCRGPLRDYIELLRFIKTLPETSLIYRKKSLGFLWIRDGRPPE